MSKHKPTWTIGNLWERDAWDRRNHKRDISHGGAKEVIISEQPERELLWHKSWGSVQGNPNGLDRPERLSRINKGIKV